MTCPGCGIPGVRYGTWRTPERGNRWARYRCVSGLCVFTYTIFGSADSRRRGVPTWMVPEKEL